MFLLCCNYSLFLCPSWTWGLLLCVSRTCLLSVAYPWEGTTRRRRRYIRKFEGKVVNRRRRGCIDENSGTGKDYLGYRVSGECIRRKLLYGYKEKGEEGKKMHWKVVNDGGIGIEGVYLWQCCCFVHVIIPHSFSVVPRRLVYISSIAQTWRNCVWLV